MHNSDDDAELYAIGALPADEAAAFEAHTRACESCAETAAVAFEMVAAVEAARPIVQPPASLAQRFRARSSNLPAIAIRPRMHWPTFALATAAALAIALLPTWLAVDRTRTLQSAMRSDEQALARIAMAPSVQHAEFMAGSKPMGKVLYGAHGDWYYIVIMHPKADMQVAYVHDGRREMLGHVAPHGVSGTLYLPVNHRMEELALVEGGTVVADAHLVY